MSEGGHWAGSEPDGWEWVDDTPPLRPGLDTFLFLRRACRHLIAHHVPHRSFRFSYSNLPCLIEPWRLQQVDFGDWHACAVMEAAGVLTQATVKPLVRS